MSSRPTPSRPRRFAGALAALLLCALALPAGAFAAPAPEQSDRAAAPSSSISDRIVVEYASDATSADRASARDDADANLVRTLGAPSFQLVTPQPGQSVADVLAALRDDPSVRTAQRDGYSELDATTNDPLFGQEWGLQNLGLGIDGFSGAVAGADADVPAAWDRTRGSSSVVLADIDTGYRADAPDLGPVEWTNPGEIAGNGRDDDRDGIVDDVHGADFVGATSQSPTTDGDPTDDNLVSGGHGVHTAGTMGAAGNNGVGISGVAQDVRIMPLRVCANDPSINDARCPTSSQILAINYAGAHGARVANMSLGGTTFSTASLDAFASNPRTLFVISAGNDTQDNDPGGTPHYPCAYDPTTSGIPGAIDNIVCVAATDQADGIASFSDWGARSVDLAAPGTEVLSTFPAQVTSISDDFQTNNFSTVWSNTGGTGFGRASSGDGPLTSFGMNDSPGVAPVANSVHDETTTTGAAIPAGAGSCVLSGRRRIARGSGGSFFYEVLSNGSSAFINTSAANTSGSGMTSFNTVPIVGLPGTTVRLHFGFTAGAAPTAADGLWLDDLKLSCNAPLSTPPTYGFLDGTSMAAPHVTGAAGLLFSLKPTATVAEAKSALLASTDAVPALAGRTVTGGRLDVAEALEALVPTTTPPIVRPPVVTPPVVTPPAGGGGGGTGGGGGASVTSVSCVVPRLAGLSLSKATTALRSAHCAVGRISKPRARRGRRLPPLVVKSSNPSAGTRAAAGTRIALTLKAKPRPKPRHRRHARRRR